MHGTARFRWWWLALPGLVAVGAEPMPPAPPPALVTPAVELAAVRDPGLDPLRRAGRIWETRPGPSRAVLDQVCLVSDLPGFFRAISAWNRESWFPVLFDEVESTTRFLRAFRPARIIRVPPPVLARDQPLWDQATAAVGSAWRLPEPGSPALDGSKPPQELGPTPPGLVLSRPDAPTLAGAVALAAGRFQPLARFESGHRYGEILRPDATAAYCRAIEEAVRRVLPRFAELGDDCDFLTLAGDEPYRVRGEDGQTGALDDRIGRVEATGERWAYAGRLMGDPAQSVAQAMASLFLQPESAFLFNGYSEFDPPWSYYATRLAAARFGAVVPTTQVAGPTRASVHGWHAAFDPANPHGLLWVNSHGSPTVFHLAENAPASPADIPRGTPTAVALIHSFSAADPANPDTIAGRWLQNGAFVFYGSVFEPFLDAFRPPLLIGELLAEKIPMAAAVRRVRAEPRGEPWRLIYLGDPLYRVHAQIGGNTRARRWGRTDLWPEVQEPPRPAANTPAADRLAWVEQAALARLRRADPADPDPGGLAGLLDDLAAIPRAEVPPDRRPRFDALVAEAWLAAGRRADLLTRLVQIPAGDRTPAVRRLQETCLAAELDRAIAGDDDARVRALWLDAIDSHAMAEFKAHATARAGRATDTPARREAWAKALRDRLGRGPELAPNTSRAVCDELDRVVGQIQADAKGR